YFREWLFLARARWLRGRSASGDPHRLLGTKNCDKPPTGCARHKSTEVRRLEHTRIVGMSVTISQFRGALETISWAPNSSRNPQILNASAKSSHSTLGRTPKAQS